MIDSPPICRVCAVRKITRLATWKLDDETLIGYTLCDHHAQLVNLSAWNLRGKLTQLPDAVKTRQQSKESHQ